MSFKVQVEGGKSVRLPTAGKYCEQDIVVTATGGGDVELPELENPATAADIVAGKEAIDGDGNVIVGTVHAEEGEYYGNDCDVYENVLSDDDDGDKHVVGLEHYPQEDVLIRAGSSMILSSPTEAFGDAAPEDVAAGKTFTSAAGCRRVGTRAETGGEDGAGAIVDRSVTEFINNNATSIGDYALRTCTKLKTVDAPNAKRVGQYAFAGCSALESANLPLVASVGQYAFNQCTALKSITLPSVTTISTNAFRDTQYVRTIDFPKLTAIPVTAFYGCRGLKALILRSPTLVTLANTSAFTTCYCILGTKNAGFNPNGEKIGFFYVPASLIEEYRNAANWSSDSLVTQFRVLEDYTVDGTITGELDPAKIAS